MQLQAGTMLGPYRIVGLIGEGGMGAVYRAKDTRLGRDVAVKILTAVTLDDHERLARFEQEARATGILNHPNLLTIFDVGTADGTPYIVSELLEGETLRDRLNRGPLAPRRALDAAQQIANGLAAAHEKGIVHRDLKPENIFLTRDGRAKILDFGIARVSARDEEGGPLGFQSPSTEPGMVLGTVGYMSPEQVRGLPVDGRSDIFAFGAIFYEMLTGQRAFRRDSSIDTLSAILKEDPPELTESIPNIPPAVERLVRRCLEKDRELRFQSARDLAFNLEMLSGMSSPGTMPGVARTTPNQQHTPTSRVAPAPPPVSMSAPTIRTTARPPLKIKQPRRVSPVLLTIFVIVAIAGAAWGGWWLANRSRSETPEVVFHRMTFRRGEVRSARFGPDGDTIVYSAAWDGAPAEVFVGNRQSPEARPLGITDAEVLSIAKTTELALLLHRDRLTGLGTLARVPIAGGTPRPIAEQVRDADWSPDGNILGAIRFENGKYRIELPVGTVRYETPHELHRMRIAPDGRIAFFETYNGQTWASVLEKDGRTPVSVGGRGWSHGATGLAWAPGGNAIWVTATDSGAPPALYAISIANPEVRLVSRLTGSMHLYDISPAGHVLLSNGMWRAALEYQPPGAAAERDASWLDWSMLADLSRDGRTILFNESREGGGSTSAIYLRQLDAAAPVRLGDGFGDAISPDGHYVLAHNGAKLMLIPTGTGEARDLKVPGAFDLGSAFIDAKRVVVAGALPEKGYALHVIDTLDESVRTISPEHIVGEGFRTFAVSPDGRFVAGPTQQGGIAIYSVDGSVAPQPVNGVQPGEVAIQWSADGAALFVYRPNVLPANVVRVTLATGAREPWKQFTPADPAGVYKIEPICITPDGSAYAYDALRLLSDLYVADGLRSDL